jgi:hypothetical protein
MQLAEIAETVLFQEWSVLKNNQRLDFFVLLYQDKRTKKIRSDFYRTKRIISVLTFVSLLLRGVFFVKKKRKGNRILYQIELIGRVINLIIILIGGTKVYTQIIFYTS